MRSTGAQLKQHKTRSLRALLELAVQAGGASGGTLSLTSGGEIERIGQGGCSDTNIAVRSAEGIVVARLTLHDAEHADGLGRLLAPLVADLPGEAHDFSIEAFERELHHRSGNLLQTVASMLHMQVENLDVRSDVTLDQGRALVTEARLRVLTVGAVQMTMEAASGTDRLIATHTSLSALAERMRDILPGRIEIETDLVDLRTRRTHASALGVMLTEFAIAATRDAFPQPARHRFHVLTTAFEENDREHVSMEIRHEAEGYDTGSWTNGSPTLASRMIEAVAMQMDGLVAIDRTDGGMRMRLVFDRPARGTAGGTDGEDGTRFAETRTFDTRFGVHAAGPAMRKS